MKVGIDCGVETEGDSRGFVVMGKGWGRVCAVFVKLVHFSVCNALLQTKSSNVKEQGREV